MVLLIIGIVLAAIGFIGAALNVGAAGKQMFSNPDKAFDNFGSTFGRQALFGVVIVIGIALAVIGLVLILV